MVLRIGSGCASLGSRSWFVGSRAVVLNLFCLRVIFLEGMRGHKVKFLHSSPLLSEGPQG